MEYLHSDVPGDESSYCRCCGLQIGVYTRAVRLVVGCAKISNKSGWTFFLPETFDDGEDAIWFHLHCIETRFDLTDIQEDPSKHCTFCSEWLSDEPLFFEFEAGEFQTDEDTWLNPEEDLWTPDKDPDGSLSHAYGCWDCVFDGIGEGHAHESRRILGMKALSTAKEQKPVKITRPKRIIPQRPRRHHAI